jgi:peptidoglycan hydrolase CwlO-like protein
MSWIKRLFTGKKQLVNELEAVKEALKECNGKLVEKQEVINKTNAYYKKKMHELKTKKPNKKDL